MTTRAILTRRQRAADVLREYLGRHGFKNVRMHPYGASCRDGRQRVWVELVIASDGTSPAIEASELECMVGYYDRIDVMTVTFFTEYQMKMRYYAHMDEILSIPMPPSALETERNTACQNLRAL